MSSASVSGDASKDSRTLFGHPTGLFTLFFAEMWERFSYYGMRALLVFYMTKGFLGYNDSRAYTVYGAYTALVYMTPFIGGLLADRLLGQRIAVIIGGLLMAAGHLVMGVSNNFAFYLAMALLIVGNGFFKPNISTIVGSLYPPGSHRRDGGFTIFYMGVNLGAAMSPLLCGYIGETYGWHYGFGLATIGMMTGLAVFVMPNFVTQSLIGAGAAGAVFALLYYRPDNTTAIIWNAFVAVCLALAGVISITALARGGLPASAGASRNPVRPQTVGIVVIGIVIAVGLLMQFVSGFSLLTKSGEPAQLIGADTIDSFKSGGPMTRIAGVFLEEISKPAGLLLAVTGFLAFGYLIIKTFTLDMVARQRMFVVLTLTFFSMLFWAFFEQAGSSLNNFADRNVDRVAESRTITESDVGQTIKLQPTQEQLGFSNGNVVFTMTQLNALRATDEHKKDVNFEIDWSVSQENVGMGIATRSEELAASMFQSVNAVCILIFGLVFTALWTFLADRGIEPSTPVKFALGLIQLGLGFAVFWYGASLSDSRGMVAAGWLVLGYVLHTTGELCLSPVGLSMITKLSPKVLVSTVMGAWFLATAFSQYLAAIISQFTGVEHEAGKENVIPIPLETVHVYGDVFKQIAIAACVCGVICLVLSPILKKWMHSDLPEDSGDAPAGGH
ncbi:MAG TPA: peptide MFS transporter [Planctomycetaceae bacterium]|nr:peptide MFS transporter [Planctomycetaceae bacterium]